MFCKVSTAFWAPTLVLGTFAGGLTPESGDHVMSGGYRPLRRLIPSSQRCSCSLCRERGSFG